MDEPNHQTEELDLLESTSSFSTPPFDPPIPFPDYVAHVARNNAERDAVILVQGDGRLNSLPWRQILDDATHQANSIVHLTGQRPRSIGEAAFTVGLLARNGYQYLVNVVALFLLRWTVSLYFTL